MTFVCFSFLDFVMISAPSVGPLVDASVPAGPGASPRTREAFDGFVAGTLFRQMLSAMRTGTGEVPYFGNGQAHQIFREQLDGAVADTLAKTSAGPLTGELFEAFAAQSGVR